MCCAADEAERHEHARIIAEQERLDALRGSRANRSRWKNARRDFLAVRAERDAAIAELVALRAQVASGNGDFAERDVLASIVRDFAAADPAFGDPAAVEAVWQRASAWLASQEPKT